MLGARDSLHAGGYARTVLERVLPVQLLQHRSRDRPFSPRPTPAARGHFAVAFDDDDRVTMRLWRALPPLAGLVRVGPAKLGARVLLEAAGAPVLVVQPYGKGRSAALLARATWRWSFSEGETARHHRRFWQQLALWLAGRERSGRWEVWVQLRPRLSAYRPGENLAVAVHALSPRGDHPPGLAVDLVVEGPGGKRKALRTVHDGLAYVSDHVPGETGRHVASVRVRQGNREVGTDRVPFDVRHADRELENPAANLSLLRELAAITGGKYYPLSRSLDLVDDLAGLAVQARLQTVRREGVCDSLWFLLVFVGLLTGEWVLRKRAGLT